MPAVDIVIIGASFGGVAAALAAAADGKVQQIVLLESSQWIGGQATSQGVTRWDEAGMDLIETVGSTKSYRNLRNAIRAHYRANETLSAYGKNAQYFNPGFARPAFPFTADPIIAQKVLLQTRERVRTAPSAQARPDRGKGFRRGRQRAERHDRGGRHLYRQSFFSMRPISATCCRLRASNGRSVRKPMPIRKNPTLRQPRIPKWIQPITVPIAVEARPAGENHVIVKPANYDDIARAQAFRVDEGDIKGILTLLPGGDETLFSYRQYVDSRNFASGDYACNRTTMNVGSNDYMAATLPTGDAVKDAAIYAGARDASVAYLYWLQTEATRDDGNAGGYPNLAPRTDAFGTADGCAPVAYIRESRRIDARTRILQTDIDANLFPAGTQRATNYAESCGIGWYGIDVHPANGPRDTVARLPNAAF